MGLNKRRYVIYIDDELCKGCDICIELCPTKVFDKSLQINKRGYYIPLPVRLLDCTGCKICDLLCPEMAVILEQEGAD